MMINNLEIFKNKRVFLTGHTGFKGAWMLQILNLLGAQVKGYSLAPEKECDLYNQLNGDQLCYSSVIGDVLDAHLLQGELIRFQPDFVFHFAAQSLVRRSYENPVDTFGVNVMGTVNLLEALRKLENRCAAVMITTDKVYENNEAGLAFKETDALGGHDPYSASKAASEIAIASYRSSFFSQQQFDQHQKSVVSLRSGNVIGGGDYSDDRIIPDIVQSIEREETVHLRNPKAVRPWQHVLEPLFAYLNIAAEMMQRPEKVGKAYNIGPDKDDVLDVETVTKKFMQYYGKGKYQIDSNPLQLHEAQKLILDNQKIKNDFNWKPQFKAEDAIRLTAEWYADKEQTAQEKTIVQILDYQSGNIH